MLKVEPYHVKKAKSFTLEGLAALTNLKWSTSEELRDLALVQFICFTSMRLEDVDFAKTDNFTIKDATPQFCRRIVSVLDRTKNDKSGSGPVSGRTFVLPCICMDNLTAAEKKKFAKQLIEDPKCACIEACPYNTIQAYLNSCPISPESSSPLAFMRALSARGGENRSLTTGKLGITMLRNLVDKVNARYYILNSQKLSRLCNYVIVDYRKNYAWRKYQGRLAG